MKEVLKEALVWAIYAFLAVGAIWVCNPTAWPFNRLQPAPPKPSASALATNPNEANNNA